MRVNLNSMTETLKASSHTALQEPKRQKVHWCVRMDTVAVGLTIKHPHRHMFNTWSPVGGSVLGSGRPFGAGCWRGGLLVGRNLKFITWPHFRSELFPVCYAEVLLPQTEMV